MKRTLAILVVMSLTCSVSYGAVKNLIASYQCDRDNFNDNYDAVTRTLNYGARTSWRVAKDQQEGNYYADWSELNLLELRGLITGPTPTPGFTWEVELCLPGSDFDGPLKVTDVQTLDTLNDWLEDAGNATPLVGACNDFANDAGGAAIPWLNVNTGAAVTFWGLTPAFVNSTQLLGWTWGVPSTPSICEDPINNCVVLDIPLVMHLIDDPNCRGVRYRSDWQQHPEDNVGCAALGQWGNTGGARLCVYEVPEPATMMLIGLGAVGLLLRKRR